MMHVLYIYALRVLCNLVNELTDFLGLQYTLNQKLTKYIGFKRYIELLGKKHLTKIKTSIIIIISTLYKCICDLFQRIVSKQPRQIFLSGKCCSSKKTSCLLTKQVRRNRLYQIHSKFWLPQDKRGFPALTRIYCNLRK